MPEPTYTGLQITTAARELREAAGADETSGTTVPDDESYPLSEVLRKLGPEIILLRERGFSDDRIADLLTGFDVEVTRSQLGSFVGLITPAGEARR